MFIREITLDEPINPLVVRGHHIVRKWGFSRRKMYKMHLYKQMYLYSYINTYIYICTHIYIYIHGCVYTYIYIYTWIYTCVYIDIDIIHIYIYIYTWKNPFIWVRHSQVHAEFWRHADISQGESLNRSAFSRVNHDVLSSLVELCTTGYEKWPIYRWIIMIYSNWFLRMVNFHRSLW